MMKKEWVVKKDFYEDRKNEERHNKNRERYEGWLKGVGGKW